MRQLRHVIALITLLLAATATAQAPDTTLPAAILNLASRAAVVFAGEVTAIRPTGDVVAIDFRVDQVLKGAATATFTLREWAGLWTGGQPRYAPGERAILFLNAPGKNGISSPVDGMDGVLPLTPTIAGPTGPSDNMTTAAPIAANVDRLAVRLQRQQGEPIRGLDTSFSIAQIAAVIHPAFAPIIPTPVRNPIGRPLPIFAPQQNPQTLSPSIPAPQQNTVILVAPPTDLVDPLADDDPAEIPKTTTRQRPADASR